MRDATALAASESHFLEHLKTMELLNAIGRPMQTTSTAGTFSAHRTGPITYANTVFTQLQIEEFGSLAERP